MKYFALLLLVITFNSHSQTGKLVCDVTNYSFEYQTPLNVTLSNEQDTFKFYNFQIYDTLKGINPGEYRALFYIADSSTFFQETVNIEENSITYFEVYFDANEEIYDENGRISNTTATGYYGYQFGTGIPENNGANNAFSLSVFGGFDNPIGRSPITLGMEYSFEYHQTNYGAMDFNDPMIYHSKQRMSNFNFSIAVQTGIILRQKKLMDIGIRYHLPLVAKFIQVDNNVKSKIKGVHNFNDIRLFAKVGFWVGFAFIEYRPVQFLKSPYPDVPKLNVGVRIHVPTF